MAHEHLLEAARQAIRAIEEDTSVEEATVIQSLEELADDIDSSLSARYNLTPAERDEEVDPGTSEEGAVLLT